MKSFKLRAYATGVREFEHALSIFEDGASINAIVLTTDELKCLMQTIQSVLPMEVCEGSDVKHLNRCFHTHERNILELGTRVKELENSLKKDADNILHLNKRLRDVEAKIVSIVEDLRGHAGKHMSDNLVDKVGSLVIKVEMLEKTVNTSPLYDLCKRVWMLEQRFD